MLDDSAGAEPVTPRASFKLPQLPAFLNAGKSASGAKPAQNAQAGISSIAGVLSGLLAKLPLKPKEKKNTKARAAADEVDLSYDEQM